MSIETKNPLGEQPVNRLLSQFAIPSIISMLVGSLYNIVDQFFIGQRVGELGNAATNIAFPVNIICTAVALLLGIGSASNFNLKSGAGHTEKAKNTQPKYGSHSVTAQAETDTPEASASSAPAVRTSRTRSITLLLSPESSKEL